MLFGLFYSAVSFLDIFLNEFGDPTDPAIPNQYREDRVKFVHSLNVRYWDEHVTMFDDYNKAAALCKDAASNINLFRIQLTMLESCTNISTFVGEVFRAFDMLIRYRDLYNKLPPAFP